MNSYQLMQTRKPYSIVYDRMPMQRQQRAYHLCWRFNQTDPLDHQRQFSILKKLFQTTAHPMINPPFHCDYGFNVRFHDFAFLNYGAVILDTSPVTFGKGVMIGPHVCLACSGHPINYHGRQKGMMTSAPITIGDDVWIGANCFIKGGVTIGQHSVIGAGSTVTHDIPADVVAFGSPCRVRRKIAVGYHNSKN